MPVELQEQLNLDLLLNAMDDSIQQELPEFSMYQLFERLLHGTFALDFSKILEQILTPLYQDVAVQCTFLGQMVLLAIVYALLRQMIGNFSGGSIRDICSIMIRAVAIVLLLQSGSVVLLYGQETILRLANLMQLFLPVQLALMTVLGNIQTAGLLEPSLLFIVQIAVWCFRTVLLPVVMIEFLLKLVNSFHDTYHLYGLATILRKLTITCIAFTTMLLLAVLSIQGIGGHILDSLSLRTAKYIAGTAIPIVGGTLSGLLETLLNGATMIRSAVGMIGLLAVMILTVLPAIKLLIIYFLYSFVAAILQPIGEDCISTLLEQAAGSFMLLFAIVALTGVFFFFMILIVLAASGAVLG